MSKLFYRIKFHFSWAGRVYISVIIRLLVLVVLGLALRSRASQHAIDYWLVIFLPAVLAFLTVIWNLYKSGYVKIAMELGHKRSHDPANSAGLGYVVSTSRKILMNLQKEDPWKDMWCLPGGYFNPGKGDLTPRQTAER